MISKYIKGRLNSFKYAFSGIAELWKKEKNTRIYLFFTIAVLLAGVIFRIKVSEWIILIWIIGAIWSAEAVNSAVERTVDLSTSEQKPLAKAAKDLAAGAVLILAICSVIIGLIIFLPKLLVMIMY